MLYIGVVSCTQESLESTFSNNQLNDDIFVIVPDTSSTLSKEKAARMACDLLSISTRDESKVIESINPICDESGSPLIYAVNFANDKGFVILSASKDYYPILAESEEGHFDLSSLNYSHPTNMWFQEQIHAINHSESLPDSIRRAIASKWMDYNYGRKRIRTRSGDTDKPQVYYDSLNKWIKDPNIDVYTYEYYIQTDEYKRLADFEKEEILRGILNNGNSNYGSMESSTLVLRYNQKNLYDSGIMLKTKWGQSKNFNMYVPNNAVLGCAPVAAGQIMKYHEFPTYINWSDMNYYSATETSAKFLYELGRQMGITYKNPDDTGAYPHDIGSAIKKYGYSVSMIKHDIFKIEAEVRAGVPVLIIAYNSEGDGHGWVCDGYKRNSTKSTLRVMTLEYRPTTYSDPSEMIEAYRSQTYLDGVSEYHYNWGWFGLNDGYFYASDKSVSPYNSDNEYTIDRYNYLIRK